ncbi:MAG: bidirectional hydrogenase complex protein HoxE [Armatimonadetes bacterium]|nr:bidirectional hydrogenase complex protein HoxE [Armatimonadota bacterium]
MPSDLTKIAAPSDDKRWRIVDATMRRHGRQPHALIETLHTVQEAFGYLDDDALQYVAAILRLPLSKVYGVATFYHFFTLKPQGKHTCVVCMGTACYIKGAPQIVSGLESRYGVTTGETTEDGELSVLSARCLGSCGLAPAIVLDGDVVGRLEPSAMLERIDGMMQKEAVAV